MPLPKTIRTVFDLAQQDGETDESQFYGPYNALLTFLFPLNEMYMVVPPYKCPAQLGSVDLVTMFIVRHNQHPVFFLKVKSSGSLNDISSRKEADLQMREQFQHLFEDVKIETLYGVSAMGSKICIYKLDRASGRLSPTVIPTGGEFVTDTTPIDRWNVDILTPGGEEQLRQVAQHIKEMLRQL
ncbi:hypothetical protein HOY82DRAFT_512278 [Tuber indicum]|nr:hypothetical protein HOY82DRAFT_512278 [Tuber indicum]